MLDTVGNNENFEAWYTNDGEAATGLTVTVNVRDPSGTLIVTGAGATEVGDGYYTYSLSSSLTTTPGIYRALFMTSGTVDQKHQPSEWILGKAWVASHPPALPNASGGVLTVGTGSGQLNPSGGKLAATLAGADMSGNPPTDWLNAAALKADAVTKIQIAIVSGGAITTAAGKVSVGDIANNAITAAALASDAAAEIAVAIEAAIINEADGQAVLAAIVAKINATDVDLAGLSVAAITTAVAAQIISDHGTGLYTRNTEPPTVIQVRQEMDANSTKLDATVSSRSTYAGGAVAGVTAPVTVGTNNDKVGYSLAAAGLDAISIADPGGVAGHTTLPKLIVGLYRRFFRKATRTTTQIKTYADDGTTVNTTQSVSDDGSGNESQGAAA